MKDVVTIDGPAGAGKSYISRRLASMIGYSCLDTGAMYRAAGLFCLRHDVDLMDRAMVESSLSDMAIAIDGDRVFLNGEDVSGAIRTPEIDKMASMVSSVPAVRSRLTELQRKIGEQGRIVAEGRDMGTVVFPDARFKFFLTASSEERARRRVLQLEESGINADFNQILKSIKERDHADSVRDIAPLKKADDAVEIDSTDMTREEVLEMMIAVIREKEPD
jgi:cytidylate kinase